jgi:protein ImuA
MARGALHEVYAASVEDAPAAIGFTAALAIQAAAARTVVWVRQDRPYRSAGRLYPPGLAELGLDPAQLIVVQARDATGVLRAALEAARCPAVGAALIELWGEARVLDLTATRRLSLAAAQSGATVLLARIAAHPVISAASTRWEIRTVVSVPLEANAPGLPSFNVALKRHRSLPGRDWQVEWDRDRHSFRPVAPLSRAVPALPVDRTPLAPIRPVPAGEGGLRRAG